MQRRFRYFNPECIDIRPWPNRIVENEYEIQRFQPPDLWQATLRDYSNNETDLKKRENERLKELFFRADNPALRETFRTEIPSVIQKRINEHKKSKAKKEAKEVQVEKVKVKKPGFKLKSTVEHSRSRSVTKVTQKKESVNTTIYKDFDDYNRHSRFTKFPSGHTLRIKSQKDLGVRSQKDVTVTPLPRSFLKPSYGQSLRESVSREWPKFPSQLQRVLGKIVVKRYDPQHSSSDDLPPPKEDSEPKLPKPPPSPPKPPPPTPKPKKEPSIPPNLPGWLHELAVRYKGKKFKKLPLWQVLIIALLEEQERLTRKKEKENLSKKLKKKATLESLIRQQRYEDNINAITKKIKRSITPFVRTSIMKNKHSAYRY